MELGGQEVVVFDDILEKGLAGVLFGVFSLAVLQEVHVVDGLADPHELFDVSALGDNELGLLVELVFTFEELVIVDLAVVTDEIFVVVDLEVFLLVAGEVIFELADCTLDTVLCRVDVLEASVVVLGVGYRLLAVFLANLAEFEVGHFDSALVAPLEVLAELRLDVSSLCVKIGAEDFIGSAS